MMIFERKLRRDRFDVAALHLHCAIRLGARWCYKHRRVPLFYFFFFGPGLRVPFNSRAFSIWASFQSLTALPFTSLTRGALIFRVAIQNCKVARGILVILATCTVV
jgi:hypothetical protein